jgi:hypothetical protein
MSAPPESPRPGDPRYTDFSLRLFKLTRPIGALDRRWSTSHSSSARATVWPVATDCVTAASTAILLTICSSVNG